MDGIGLRATRQAGRTQGDAVEMSVYINRSIGGLSRSDELVG